jgi:hypothetical protein
MKQLLTVLSARASYSRVRSVLLSLRDMGGIDSHVILIASAASSKYGKLEYFLQKDGIEINWKIESQADAALESSMVRTTSYSMLGISDYILNNNIDYIDLNESKVKDLKHEHVININSGNNKKCLRF